MSEIQRKRYKSPKEREKQSIALRKRWEDKERRKKQSETIKKHWEDKNEREKQSIIQRKRWEDKELREKISKIQRKNWEDQEYRKKQNIAQRKRWENTKEKEKITGEKNGRAKKVYCNELNIVFSYIKIAEEYCKNVLNSKISSISAACNGKLKSTGKLANGTKLTWNWTENVDKKILDKAEYIDNKKYKEIINERKKCGIPYELNYYATSVYCNELNIIFSYIKIAKKYCKNVLNSKISPIGSACDGKIKYSGKYNGIKLTWNWTKNLDKETLNNAEYIDDKCYEEIINGNKKHLENPGIKKIQNERLLCEKHGNAKSVYCDTLNIIFSYIGLAKKYCENVLNSKISSISNVCDGKVKYSGELADGTKLIWNWTKNLDKKTLNNAEYIDSKKYEEIINKRKNCGIPCELNYHTTSVYCNELNVSFSYIALATEYCKNVLNIKIGRINHTCNGKAKYSGKLADGTKLT